MKVPDELTSAALLGSWRTLTLWGVELAAAHPRDVGTPGQPGWRGGLTFHLGWPRNEPTELAWLGHDGCNWTGGRVHVSTDGAFSTTDNFSTLIGCLAVDRTIRTMVDAVTLATRIEVDGRLLSLLDDAGTSLGTFLLETPTLHDSRSSTPIPGR